MNYEYLKRWYDEMMVRTEGRGRFLKPFYLKPLEKNDTVADLHGHTSTFSDGERPIDFYKKTASRNGVKTLAITDHDSIGMDDAPEGYINGVEITTHLGENEIEILVYNYDQAKAEALVYGGQFPYLNRSFKILRNLELTKKRIDICNRLQITSKPVSLSDILGIDIINEKGQKETISLSEIGVSAEHIILPGRALPTSVVYKNQLFPLNYNFLIRKLFDCIHSDKKGLEYLCSKAKLDSSFNPHSSDDFMKSMVSNKNGDFYIETEGFWPTVEEVIEFARATGGVAILAHPFGYNKKINITKFNLVKKLNKKCIDGFEIFYGFNQRDEVEFLYKYCYENGMAITIGSDTHGYYSTQGGIMEPGIAPGMGHQSRFVDGNIDQDALSIYNMFYYGTGAWRGETEFDHLSYPPSIHEVFKAQEKAINKSKNIAKKKKKTVQESQPMV